MKISYWFLLSITVPFFCISMEEQENHQSWKLKTTVRHDKRVKYATLLSRANKLVITDWVDGSYIKNNVMLKSLDPQSTDITFKHEQCRKPIISPKENYIITNPESHLLLFYNSDGKEIGSYTTEESNRFTKATCNADENKLVVAGHEKVDLFNIENNKIEATMCSGLHAGCCTQVARFMPNDERLIFLAYRAHSHTKLWDTRANKATDIPIPLLKKASLHPTGNYVACITKDNDTIAYLYDIRTGGNIKLTDYESPRFIHFNNTGSHILTFYPGSYFTCPKLALWNMQALLKSQKNPHSVLCIKRRGLTSGKFNPSADNILSCTHCSDDNSFSIEDFSGKKLAHVPQTDCVYDVNYDATSDYVVARHPNAITIWYKEN